MFVHADFATFTPNVIYAQRAGVHEHLGGLGGLGEAVERLENDGGFCIRSAQGHLSADPSGITRWTWNLQAWEIFTLMPLDEAQALKQEQLDSRIPKFSKPYGRNRIPNIIHQTSAAREARDKYCQNVEALKSANPDWIYRHYTDKDVLDFIYQEYGYEILEFYMRISPHYGSARADLFRYLCIYHYGGVYLDIKSTCAVPLNEVIRPDDEYLLSYWNNEPGQLHEGFGFHAELPFSPRGEYQQWHVIACPRHPFLERVIKDVLRRLQNYDEQSFGVGKRGVLRVTGPIVYTLAIHPLLDLHPHRFIDADAEGLVYATSTTHHFGLRHYALQRTPVVI